MAVNLSPIGGVAAQFFDNSGNVLSGGKIYTYAAGTTTPQATYTSASGTTPLANPIILDAAGRVPTGEIWLTDGLQYKFIIKTSTDVQIGSYDNIVGINSNFVNYTNSQEFQTATAGQTVFTLTTMQYQPGTNSLSVFVDGVNQYGPGASYAYQETSSTVVTFTTGLHVGASVKFTTSTINSSAATDAEQVSYTPPFTGSVATSVENKLAQYLSVKDFGAIGDGVIDDTAAIQAAVNFASTGGQGAVIYFPPGIYRTTQTILIDASGVILEGDQRLGATSFSPMEYAGSMIYYTANDGNPIVQVGANTQVRYFNELRNIRIGAAASVTVKPIGLLLAGLSEFVLKSVSVNGNCSVGYSFVSVGIGSITDFYVGACDIGIRFDVSGPTAFISCVNLWFSGGNIWNSTDDAVQINCSTRQIVFRDSWIEYAPNGFHFKQLTAKNIYPELFLHNVEFSSSAPGPLNSRFMRATAAAVANDLRVFAYIYDCRTFNSGATYNIEYTKGTNTSPNSYYDQMQINNCIFYGASTSVATSDTISSSVFASGRLTKTDAFGGGSVIPLTDGTLRQHSLTTTLGYWDMVGSLPLRLPTQGALSYATAGQLWFESVNRIGYSAATWRVLLPRPQVATYVDESITVNVTDSAETLRFNTPLTTNRTVTLSPTGTYNGAKFRVVRAAGATGASTLSVGGLRTLAVNEWCDVEHNGSSWVLTAAGAL